MTTVFVKTLINTIAYSQSVFLDENEFESKNRLHRRWTVLHQEQLIFLILGFDGIFSRTSFLVNVEIV